MHLETAGNRIFLDRKSQHHLLVQQIAQSDSVFPQDFAKMRTSTCGTSQKEVISSWAKHQNLKTTKINDTFQSKRHQDDDALRELSAEPAFNIRHKC